MNHYFRLMIQFLWLLLMSIVVHYLIFWLVGLYDFGGVVTGFLTEIKNYFFVLVASWIMWYWYGKIYPYWKKTLRRLLAIIHWNVVSYYFLIWWLDIDIDIARIIIIWSMVGRLIAYSTLKKKNIYLTAIVVLTVWLAMIESIPVYPHTINISQLLDNQHTRIFPLSDISGQEITIQTETKTQSYLLDAISDEKPLIITSPVSSLTYEATNKNTNIPVLIQTYNWALIYLYPQTKIVLQEIKDQYDIRSSETTIDIIGGNAWVIFHQKSWFVISWAKLDMRNNAVFWKNEQVTWASETEMNAYRNAFTKYQDDLRSHAKELYAWTWSDSPLLEKISQYKIEFYQLFDPFTYNTILDNFNKYRYLLFWDQIEYASDIDYIPLERIQQKVLEQNEDVSTYTTVRDAASGALKDTRFLGDWFGN